jgi:hypothetical protein
VLALCGFVVAAIVALSAVLSAPSGADTALAIAGLALLAVRRPLALVAAVAALGAALAVAIHEGAPTSGAPLWGAGLLVAAHLAERALDLPRDGEIEAGVLIAWLAALGTLAGVGLAAGALVLLAAGTDLGTTAAGLVAAALLAVLPSRLARGARRRGG